MVQKERSDLESEGKSARKHRKQSRWGNGRRSERQTENMSIL